MEFVRQIARQVTGFLHQGTVPCEGTWTRCRTTHGVIEVYLGSEMTLASSLDHDGAVERIAATMACFTPTPNRQGNLLGRGCGGGGVARLADDNFADVQQEVNSDMGSPSPQQEVCPQPG